MAFKINDEYGLTTIPNCNASLFATFQWSEKVTWVMNIALERPVRNFSRFLRARSSRLQYAKDEVSYRSPLAK